MLLSVLRLASSLALAVAHADALALVWLRLWLLLLLLHRCGLRVAGCGLSVTFFGDDDDWKSGSVGDGR